VLAINRHETTLHSKISQIPLQMGDVLLVQGSRFNIASLEKNNTFRVLGMVEDQRLNYRRAWLATGIFVGALLLAIFNLVSVPVAVLLGSLAAFLTRCITPEEAYRDIEWKAIILIGSMLAFGSAMEYTGTAKFLAMQIVEWIGHSNPVWLLTGFFALTVMLTQPMSNQAAAAVVLPVALQTAIQLGLNPRTFAMMIALAASTSFITPLEPACLIVYGLGRYRFTDFTKVGSLLTVVIYIIAIFLVPRVWPLY
jgi:di/tricarboxylate transporter